MDRIESIENAVIVGNMDDPAPGHDDEPQRRDRSEDEGDGARPARLDEKQPDQDGERDRQDVVAERRIDELETFHRRKHGEGRCDHGVTQKQRGTDQAENHQNGGVRRMLLLQKGQQRQRAAFAIIVGAQQEKHVFDRHDHDQCPDDQRGQADDFLAHQTVVGDRLQRFTKGVKRAGADVAVNDTDRTQRGGGKAAHAVGTVVRVLFNFRIHGVHRLLEPAFPAKDIEGNDCRDEHQGKGKRIAEMQVELWHELEIHAVDRGHQRRRQEDHRGNGENLDDRVLLDIDEAERGIQQKADIGAKEGRMFGKTVHIARHGLAKLMRLGILLQGRAARKITEQT